MTARDSAETITVKLPDDVYLRRLHVLGAWWSLGSSALEPRLLLPRVQASVTGLYEAGL